MPLRNRRNAFSFGADDSMGEHMENMPPSAHGHASSGDNLRTMSEEDPRLQKILSRFSVDENENAKGSSTGSALTAAQINAFKEVFDLFDSNGGGTIDADELDLALQSVGIALSHDDLAGVLETMDKDGNGEIDFNEFLNLMTNTEKFLESCDNKNDQSMEEEKRRREIMLFEALTQFMKSSALHSMEEIVGFFSSKYKRSQAPHVVGHYAAGARLIGLTEKQIQKHMEHMRATNANSNSPYAQPLYNLNVCSKRIKTTKVAPVTDTGAKKIRLKIILKSHVDTSNLKKPCQDDERKRDNIVRGVKSASDITNPPCGDTVSKKPRQITVKKHGWTRDIQKPLSVRLPTVKHRGKKKGILTFDDLPAIRNEVEKVKQGYYKQIRLKKTQEVEQHWQSLTDAREQITSNVLKKRFRKVFRTYSAVS